MKSYVKREWTGMFSELVITTDNVSEWTAIKTGLDYLIDDRKKSIEFFNDLLAKADNEDDKNRHEDTLKECEEYLKMLEDMRVKLDVKNEIPIEKYSIKEQKVDYEFDDNIEGLEDKDILKKLNSIFPDKKLYMLPHFRGTSSKRATVLGHNGNVVFTYKK